MGHIGAISAYIVWHIGPYEALYWVHKLGAKLAPNCGIYKGFCIQNPSVCRAYKGLLIGLLVGAIGPPIAPIGGSRAAPTMRAQRNLKHLV